jgi:glycosyltransferase involved in cell wall biosynthesis
VKICLVGPIHPLRGGIAHYNAQLGLELARRHEVVVISYSRQYPTLFFPGRTQFDPSPHSPALAREDLLDSVNPLTWRAAARRVAELAPHVTVVHWWNPFFGLCIGSTLRLAKRRSHFRTVFICHNIVPHEPFPAAAAFTRFALATGDTFLVHSTADLRALEALRPGGEIVTVSQPPGRGFGESLGKEVARSRLGLSGNTLLFFGLIRRYKGLPRLLEAMPRVLEKVDCTLLVVGEFYEGKEQCLQLISQYRLETKVRVIDRFVPDEEVGLYFCAADLIVLPYESATQSAIVPIAFAFERPVVATRVGGLPEAVRDGDTGLLIEPMRADALADAIVRFYEEDLEPSLRRNIALGPRFSWHDLATTLEATSRGKRKDQPAPDR